ncbi:MAG: hypothetical protein AVDCRST_MAG45-344 [uncultured Solirubrobacterales bacterium]|uniref:Uncharacterized protein n=1 Tax=uncultured Solirubrobacterales bacterium TaxID=768556 RepID=A0A6J4S351_9ACTN|nr:MAG: hypothetical protein AVDCRST_MAG45-344 [uncultured Solirubrobacterales bacterium]
MEAILTFRDPSTDQAPSRRIPLLNGRGWRGRGWSRQATYVVSRCLACGHDVLSDDSAVELHGSVFHASCSRYRRQH